MRESEDVPEGMAMLEVREKGEVSPPTYVKLSVEEKEGCFSLPLFLLALPAGTAQHSVL